MDMKWSVNTLLKVFYVEGVQKWEAVISQRLEFSCRLLLLWSLFLDSLQLESRCCPCWLHWLYFALHAELNSLDADSLPAICGDVERLYVKEGQYGRDLNITVGIAEEFFGSVRPQVDSRDIVLIDADDLASETLFSYYLMHRINEDPLHGSSGDPDYLRHTFARKLYLKLQSDGWPLVLFSRKPEKLRSAMAEYLISMGCPGWSSLIMRKENEMQMSFQEYISGQRIILQREGLRIVAVISSRMDALRGPYLGNRMFKFPSPMFRHSMENHVESHVQKSK